MCVKMCLGDEGACCAELATMRAFPLTRHYFPIRSMKHNRMITAGQDALLGEKAWK